MHINLLPLPVQKIYSFWETIFQNTNVAAEKMKYTVHNC